MNILINILVLIICLVIGYLFGSIPNAVWIGKVFFKKDPRDYGSHNAGATNAGRLFGKGIGFIVIVLDVAKAMVPLWGMWAFLTYVKFDGQPLLPTARQMLFGEDISMFIIQWPVYWVVTISTMIGHCWPIFAHFKGGKAVTVYYTSLIGTSWMLGFIPFVTVYMGCLKLKKYVSLSSIVTSIVYAVLAWAWAILVMSGVITGEWVLIPSYFKAMCYSWHFAVVVTIGAIIVVLRHMSNIKRLKNGNESKIKWMK